MANKGINWFNMIVAMVILICGAVIFFTFDGTIVRMLGLLASVIAIGFIISLVSKSNKDNINLDNEFNNENKKPTASANESLGLSDDDQIKIKNYQKNNDPIIKTEGLSQNISTPEGINIHGDTGDIKYNYGESNEANQHKAYKKNEPVATVRDADTNTFMETAYDTGVFLKEEQGRIIGSQPRKEFEYFVSRILLVLRSLTKSKTAVFAIVDKKSNKFTIESYVTNSPEAISPKITYEISSCIVSKTIQAEEPQILSEINPNSELDLLPYYNKHVGALSLAAFPVFGWEGIAGVVCLDSTFAGAFTAQTTKLVDKFTELLSAVVFSYINKYELLQAAKTLEAITLFYYSSNSANMDKISESLIQALHSIFDCSASGICLYNEKNKQWGVTRTYAEKNIYYSTGCIASVSKSIIGKAITENNPTLYDYQKNEPRGMMRICKNEPNLEAGSFLAIPIRSDQATYGAFYIIDEKRAEYTDYELEILKTLGYHVGLCFDKLELMNILNNSAIMDIETRMLNTMAFNNRLTDEIARAKDFNTNLVLCLFKIDKYTSIDWNNQELNDLIHTNVFNTTQKKLRIYDLFGSADTETYGIVLIDYTKADAKIWAESLRKDTANSILEFGGTKLSVTFSMGLSVLKPDDTFSSLLDKTNKAMIEALSQSNKVCTF